MSSWWLQSESGIARRLDTGTLTLGRSLSCDVVLESGEASRIHALVSVVHGQPVLVPLGQAPILRDGEPVLAAESLSDGCVLTMPGTTFQIVGHESSDPSWTLRCGDMTLLVGRRLTVGGGSRDAIRLSGVAEGAAELSVVGDVLVISVNVAARYDDEPLEAGDMVYGQPGRRLVLGDHELLLSMYEVEDGPTEMASWSNLPIEATLEFEPTGGRLRLTIGSTKHEVLLSELRARLVASLLTPPSGFEPGEHLPDEVLIPRIWPGEDRGRLDVNQLLYRTRHDLLAIGVDGLEILSRARGGRATAFLLAPGARVGVV